MSKVVFLINKIVQLFEVFHFLSALTVIMVLTVASQTERGDC